MTIRLRCRISTLKHGKQYARDHHCENRLADTTSANYAKNCPNNGRNRKDGRKESNAAEGHAARLRLSARVNNTACVSVLLKTT